MKKKIKIDYTDGQPFWKWFFSQTANKCITAFWVIAMVVIYYNERGFFTDGETSFATLFVNLICFLNLGLSYREYKQLQKGISK